MDERLRNLETAMNLMLIMSFWQAFAELPVGFNFPDRDKAAEALDHEPNLGNMLDFQYFKRNLEAQQNDRQRETDREKLRRLVFGENDDSSKAK
jgi:hypothetical protein